MSLTKAINTTYLLFILGIVSKIIGFVRSQILAAYYGTEMIHDVIVLTITIPTLIITITGGALSGALIPIIIRLQSNKEDNRLLQLNSSMFSITTLVMIGLTLLLYFYIEFFVYTIYARKYPIEGVVMIVELLKIIVPTLVAIGLISLFSSMLNAYKQYLIPSLGGLFYSAGIIIALIFFSDTYGSKSLILGMAAGIMIHLLLCIFVVYRHSIRLTPRIWWNEDLKYTGIVIFPILLSVGIFQLNTLVDKMMTTSLEVGSVTALDIANRVIQLPISLFLGVMIIPLFPMIAEKLIKKEIEETRELLRSVFRLLAILLLPVTGLFIVLSEPIISILFQRGKFTVESTELTSLALIFYSLTLLPFAMRDVITRVFYSLGDTWTPVINSFILVAINISLMVILVPHFGIMGVAGSTSIASIVAYLRIRQKLNKKIGYSSGRKGSDRKVWFLIWRNALLCIGMTWLSYQGLFFLLKSPTGVHLWVRLLSSLGIGGALYIYLTLKLATYEVQWIRERVSIVNHFL